MVQLPERVSPVLPEKKIDGFVTQYAETVGLFCCTLSVENDSGSIYLMRTALLQSLNSWFS